MHTLVIVHTTLGIASPLQRGTCRREWRAYAVSIRYHCWRWAGRSFQYIFVFPNGTLDLVVYTARQRTMLIAHAEHLFPNKNLINHGYPGCSPIRPSIAISLRTLSAFQQAHHTCLQFSIWAQCKALCHLHDVRQFVSIWCDHWGSHRSHIVHIFLHNSLLPTTHTSRSLIVLTSTFAVLLTAIHKTGDSAMNAWRVSTDWKMSPKSCLMGSFPLMVTIVWSDGTPPCTARCQERILAPPGQLIG